LVGKSGGNKRRRVWEDNIKMDIRGIGLGCMDWIDLSQDRDRWRAFFVHGDERFVSIKCWKILE
jgi:hypothetical protein